MGYTGSYGLQIVTTVPRNLTELDSSMIEAWSMMGPLPDGWYLAGGTALVLYFGHRQSTDLDWCASEGSVNIEKIYGLSSFDSYGVIETVSGGEGMVDCRLRPHSKKWRTIEMTFFEPHNGFAPQPKHEPMQATNAAQTPVMHPIDLASCKIQAIYGRGEKRDFEDLSELAKNHPEILREGLFQLKTRPDTYLFQYLKAMVSPGEKAQVEDAILDPLRDFVRQFSDW